MIDVREILSPDMFLLCVDWQPVGSRVTCSPAPTDTDEDWLLLVKTERLDSFFTIAKESGWESGTSLGGGRHGSEFVSLKLGDVNLICTESRSFWDRFLAASSVAKRLNLLNKADRIALFRAVLYAQRCG